MRPFRSPAMHGPWIIWFAVTVHMGWGAMLMVSDAPTGTTPINWLAELITVHRALGMLFIGVGLASAYGLLYARNTREMVAWAWPQQTVLMLTSFSALTAIVSGEYADGVPRPHLFILADQLPSLTIVVFHTAALLEVGRSQQWR